MTKAVALSSSWVCIYNEHTITFNPTDKINASVAVECGGYSLILLGPASSAPAVTQSYIPYADNAFFNNTSIQLGGYIAGDLVVSNCSQVQKLGNWSSAAITGTLELIGNVKQSNYYTMSGVTLGGYDLSGVTNNVSYAANTSATINDEIELPSTSDGVETLEGASIRLGEVNGIRFYTTLDAAAFEGTITEKGTLIGPANLVGALEMDDVDAGYAVAVKYDSDSLWEDNQFVGSIASIKDTNLARSFIARAYVVVDGVTYYSAVTTTRSLAEVADACVADTDYYNGLDAYTQNLVNTWAAAND